VPAVDRSRRRYSISIPRPSSSTRARDQVPSSPRWLLLSRLGADQVAHDAFHPIWRCHAQLLRNGYQVQVIAFSHHARPSHARQSIAVLANAGCSTVRTCIACSIVHRTVAPFAHVYHSRRFACSNVKLERAIAVRRPSRGDQDISNSLAKRIVTGIRSLNRHELKLIFVKPITSTRTPRKSHAPRCTLTMIGFGVSGPMYVSKRGTKPDVQR